MRASEYIRKHARDISATPIADAIVTGSWDPVSWAREYNATAGERAMEYSAGKYNSPEIQAMLRGSKGQQQ